MDVEQKGTYKTWGSKTGTWVNMKKYREHAGEHDGASNNREHWRNEKKMEHKRTWMKMGNHEGAQGDMVGSAGTWSNKGEHMVSWDNRENMEEKEGNSKTQSYLGTYKWWRDTLGQLKKLKGTQKSTMVHGTTLVKTEHVGTWGH